MSDISLQARFLINTICPTIKKILISASKPGNLDRARYLLEKLSTPVMLPTGIEIEPVPDVGGVYGEWTKSEGNTTSQAILFFHGGGYAVCSPMSYRVFTAELAMYSNTNVMAIDYRRSPEHQYPAALEDAVSSYNWLIQQKIPHKNIAIIGDSAGGNLTAACLLRLKQLGMPLPGAAVMLSPWLDLTMKSQSLKTNYQTEAMLPIHLFEETVQHFAGSADLTSPLISPVYATTKDVEGFPPILMHAALSEALLDDTRRFAEILERGGVEIETRYWPYVCHVHQIFAPYVPESRDAVLEITKFVKKHIVYPPGFSR